MSDPFRWPRREGGAGCVHIVIGDSPYGTVREQTACNCNLKKDGYNRTVAAVTCKWCLLALAMARHGDLKDVTDRQVNIIRNVEKEKGVDETIAVEAETRRQDA